MIAARRQAGFTLLEIVIVVALVILLFLVAIDRILPLRGQAEAAHVRQVVGTLRSSLGLAVAERVLGQGLDSVDSLAGSDPMRLLAEPPDNYAGALRAGDVPEPGTWYFDPRTGRLGYRVEFTGYLAGAPEAASLHWRVAVDYDDGKPRWVHLRSAADNPGWTPDPAGDSRRDRQ
ncbi:MAG: type II secretion system protein [Candidatus Wenzhouxiangella sp. M2_3B_020]